MAIVQYVRAGEAAQQHCPFILAITDNAGSSAFVSRGQTERAGLQCVTQLQSKLRDITQAVGAIRLSAAFWQRGRDLSRRIHLDEPVEFSRQAERHLGRELGPVTAVLDSEHLALVVRA